MAKNFGGSRNRAPQSPLPIGCAEESANPPEQIEQESRGSELKQFFHVVMARSTQQSAG